MSDHSTRASAVTHQKLRVAIVEDEERLRETVIVPALRDFGFDVVGAGSAGELYKCMLSRQFDIIVLDIGLPDDSGLNVVRHLRSLDDRIGLVMLTASAGHQDRVQALTDGADIYLPKPTDVEVIAATLRSLARRMGSAKDQGSAATGEWHLGNDGWCLVAPSGTLFALTSSERRLVSALLDAQGLPVSRETLIASLGEDVHEFDHHRLDMLVYRLRRKLSDSDDAPVPILTSRGTGYLFAQKP